MKQKLIDILSTFGHPVRLQGSFTENEKYPSHFFTIWNNSTDDGNHYDNEAVSYVWSFSIYFYSTDPELVNTVLLDAKRRLKKEGWIINGKGYDVPTDEPTHTGRAIDALFLEY